MFSSAKNFFLCVKICFGLAPFEPTRLYDLFFGIFARKSKMSQIKQKILAKTCISNLFRLWEFGIYLEFIETT